MARKSKPRAKRRVRGTGSIFYSEAFGLWIGRVPVGRVNGRIIYRERRDETQAGLLKKLDGLRLPGPTTTVAEWVERWHNSLSVRSSTSADYRHTIDKYIVPSLGGIPIKDLTPFHIEHAAREWSASLGPNTVRKNLGQLATCMEAARKARLITENPAADARRPKAKRVQIDPFSPDELAMIIAGAKLSRGCTIFALLASTGLRLGEALALDVTDYNAAAGTVAITKTYSRRHGLGPPKSENGNRTIRVPSEPFAICRPRKRTGPLFPTPEGVRRQHTAVSKSWRAMLKRLGLRYRNPHQCRHSVITAMISGGVPIADVAKYVGDTVEVIVKRYLHATGVDPSLTMARLLGGDKVDTIATPGAKQQGNKRIRA